MYSTSIYTAFKVSISDKHLFSNQHHLTETIIITKIIIIIIIYMYLCTLSNIYIHYSRIIRVQ